MISVKGEVKMELSLKEAIKIVNDYAGRQVKQYDEAEDLFIFSPYPPNYAHYGGPTFVVYKKDGKPDYYAGSWYDPFPYNLKPVPPNWDDD